MHWINRLVFNIDIILLTIIYFLLNNFLFLIFIYYLCDGHGVTILISFTSSLSRFRYRYVKNKIAKKYIYTCDFIATIQWILGILEYCKFVIEKRIILEYNVLVLLEGRNIWGPAIIYLFYYESWIYRFACDVLVLLQGIHSFATRLFNCDI